MQPELTHLTVITRAKDLESSVVIGDLVTQINNLLYRSIRDIQALPQKRDEIAEDVVAELDKRDEAQDVQSLEARIVSDIIAAMAGLDVTEVPVLPFLTPVLDRVLSSHVQLVVSRIPDPTLLKKL